MAGSATTVPSGQGAEQLGEQLRVDTALATTTRLIMATNFYGQTKKAFFHENIVILSWEVEYAWLTIYRKTMRRKDSATTK